MHNVIVIGDKCTDKYVYGECSRLSPEQPVPVLDKTETKERPGMAANTELNLINLEINRKNYLKKGTELRRNKSISKVICLA